MTTVDVSLPQVGQRPRSDAENYLTHSHGFLSWAFTLDHKRIGVMYLISTLGFFLLGGILAMIVRTELLTPKPTVISADMYNQAFTLHGAVMIFLFLIPVIPAAIGNFVLPMMLGAKDVAFPRMNLLSYWIYAIGAVMLLTTLLMGGLDTGWTFYTPYSTTTSTAVGTATLAVFVLGFGNIFTAVNFITTIHKLRPRGMSWYDMPLFLWAQYSTSVIQILATPVLGITVLLIFVERVMGIGIFDPALGGDPVLYQHFFWFYSHPAVYIMVLPAMGVISELMSVFSRKPIFGYKAIAYSSLAIAIIGFFVWGHHMFTSGQSNLAGTIFSVLTYVVAIPSAIKVFNWVTTLYKGNIQLQTPMLYALSFIWLFGIGGLTGLFLGNLGVDLHLHDTYFVVAHFHYVMVGGTLAAFLGGLHYWWPKFFGRMYNEKLGKLGALLFFIGFNLTFFVQFVAGSKGMPRRYFNYLPEFHIYHVISTIGAYATAIAFFLILYYLLHSLVKGKPAPANPWGAASLEWQTTSPPHPHNFPESPVLIGPYDFNKLNYDEKLEGYVLKPEIVKEAGRA
ncbi:MAG: cytochrome c oxidase subunit I [Acidobacteria bacterium]|nr:cytochrome c oxidase subunit I [Acidobacteriota bacterium]